MRLLSFLAVLLLVGCAVEEHQDLREWMREEARGMKGKVAPLPEITAFPVVAYETEALVQPFAPGKIVTLDVSADKSAPDRSRPQQPLEAFPIEDLRVMGIIMAGTVPYALIQTPPPNKPKHVRVGEYMGRSFGKITSITSEVVTVLETIKDANGAWVSQERQLIVPKGGR
ncbi:MAG: pilus assembly protein PilP [Rhodocyclales bacterium]|nr:pilus assembly protein PilP [Rhodocyclales bacterium]